MRSLCARSLCFLGLLLFSTAPCSAADYYWTGAAVENNGLWSYSTNWTGGVPTSNANTCLYFQSTGDYVPDPNNNIADPFILRKLTFNSATPVAQIVGGKLSFSDTSQRGIYQNSANLVTIDNAITWTGTSALTINASGVGGLVLAGGTSTPPTGGSVNVSGNSVTLSIGTFNTGTNGNIRVGYSGPATVTIDDSAAVSVGGELDVNYQATRTGDTSVLEVVDGTLTVTGQTLIGRGAMPGDSDDYSAKLLQTGGSAVFNNLVTVGYNGTARSLYDLSDGTANANAGMVVGGSGNGILSVRGGGTLGVSGGSGLIVGQNANRATAGVVELSGGTLNVTGNVTLGNNSGVGTLNRTSGALTVSGNLITGGAATLIVDATAGDVPTTFGGTLQRSGVGTLVVTPYTGDLGTSEAVNFTTNPTLTNGIIGPWAVRQASGGDSTGDYLKTTGGGPYKLATADYTSTNFAGSTATSVVTVTNPTTLSSATSAYVVRSGPVTTTINGGITLTLSGGGLILNGGTITGGTVNCQSNTVLVYAGTENASTIGSALQGTAGMVKFGPGKLILSGNNTSLSGATYINSGTLNVQNANALGAAGSSHGTLVAADASLELQGGIAVGNEYLTAGGNGASGSGALRNVSGTNSLAGPVTLSSPTLINTIAGNLTLSGAISGNAFTKMGAGMLALSGNSSSFISTITVAEGVLKAQNSGALGISGASSATTVIDGAQLAIQGSGLSIAETLAISGTGPDETGVLRNISGSNTLSGPITFGTDSQIGVDAGTLTLSNLNVNDFNFTKSGAGALVISNGIDTEGDITVTGGSMTCASIRCSTLTIGSGMRLTIAPIGGGAGGAPAAGGSPVGVPEPGSFTLLLIGFAVLCFYLRKQSINGNP